MKTGFRFLTVLSLVLLLPACAPAAPASKPNMTQAELVKAYETAFNNHDVDGTLALMAGNPHIQDEIYGVNIDGQRQAQGFFDYLFTLNANMKISDCENTSEATVVCKTTYNDDCTRAACMEDYRRDLQFNFLGQAIQRLAWTNDAEQDLQKYCDFMDQYEPWLKTAYPDEFDQVMNEPYFDHTLGEINSQRCQEFAAASK